MPDEPTTLTVLEDKGPKNAIDYIDVDQLPAEARESLAERASNTRKLIENCDYSILPPMRNFDKDRLEVTEFLAKGMGKQEILDYFGIVSVLTRTEKAFFDFAYKRGCSKGKREAMEKFFQAMGDRNGGNHSFKYLQVHAERFPDDGSIVNPNSDGKYNFTVNLKD